MADKRSLRNELFIIDDENIQIIDGNTHSNKVINLNKTKLNIYSSTTGFKSKVLHTMDNVKEAAEKSIDLKTTNKRSNSDDGENKKAKKKPKIDDPMEYKLKIRLANSVQDENILWNQKNKDHRNQIKMNAAWNRVAVQLDITVEKAKKLWKACRDCRNSVKNKNLPSGSGLQDKIDMENEIQAKTDISDKSLRDQLIDSMFFFKDSHELHPNKTIELGASTSGINIRNSSEDKENGCSLLNENNLLKNDDDSSSSIDETSKPFVYGINAKKTAVKKENKKKIAKKDEFGAQLVDSIHQLTEHAMKQNTLPINELKFNNIWANLDMMCQRLDEIDVILLGAEFVKMVSEKIREKQQNV